MQAKTAAFDSSSMTVADGTTRAWPATRWPRTERRAGPRWTTGLGRFARGAVALRGVVDVLAGGQSVGLEAPQRGARSVGRRVELSREFVGARAERLEQRRHRPGLWAEARATTAPACTRHSSPSAVARTGMASAALARSAYERFTRGGKTTAPELAGKSLPVSWFRHG
jgi:hypothetical protein